MADELAKVLFDPGIFKQYEEFQSVVLNAIDKYERYLNASPPGEERCYLEEFLDTLKEGRRIAKGLDDFLSFQFQRLRKVKTVAS